jgi:RHS repeat-associated protein
LTGTTYNASGAVTHLSFGSADTDDFTYDSNTGRMTQYKFTMNGQPEIGTPTWNSNGTLASLSIVDPFNSLGGQTCTYSYDDLERITGTSCGSTWAQTFGFDPFGNISKSGSSSFQASYSSATNRVTMIGTTFVPTYDANGNVTNDGFHTYAWDAEGHMVGLDTGTSAYDALGELIEGNASGFVWQYYNDPSGNRLGLVFPQSAGGVNLKLPAGAVAVYSSGTLQNYWHPDWLGSSRLGSTPSRTLFSDVAFAPYGEPYAGAGSTYKSFSGYSRNQAVDMYDTLFREYHATQGRWITPDPAGMAAVDMTNPQSWNRYVYVLNNPLRAIDPTGLICKTDQGCPTGDDGDGGTPPPPPPLAPLDPLWHDPTPVCMFTLTCWRPTIPVAGGNHMGPGVLSPKQNVAGILGGTNPCSSYFNATAQDFTEGSNSSAVSIFDAVNIKSKNNQPFTPVAAQTSQGTGAFSVITVNLNSPWTLPVALTATGPKIYYVGPFVASTPQGHLIELLHEFAHNINPENSTAFPRDGLNSAQSAANTQTIIQNCGSTVQDLFPVGGD